MPKYWGGNYFAHGRFPEVGQKQKTEKKKKEEILNDGDNNGQAMHGARKPPGPKYSIGYFRRYKPVHFIRYFWYCTPSLSFAIICPGTKYAVCSTDNKIFINLRIL